MTGVSEVCVHCLFSQVSRTYLQRSHPTFIPEHILQCNVNSSTVQLYSVPGSSLLGGRCAAAIWVVLCCPLGAVGRAAQNHSRQMSSEVTLPYQLWCSQPWAAERVRCSQAQREKAIQRSTSRWGWYKSDTYTSFPTWLCAPQFCYTLQTGPLLCFEKSVVTSQGRLV